MDTGSRGKKRPKCKVKTGPGVPCEVSPNQIGKNFKNCILNFSCQWHPQLRARPHEQGLLGSKTLNLAFDNFCFQSGYEQEKHI